MPAPKMKSEIIDDNPDYCALCTVDLTSDVMARAHYQGENHASALEAVDGDREIERKSLQRKLSWVHLKLVDRGVTSDRGLGYS